MNITAINTLADLLENIPAETKQGFNMSTWFNDELLDENGELRNEDENQTNVEHHCGSVACIAGWTASYLSLNGSRILNRPRKFERWTSYPALAKRLLDLSDKEAYRLFQPFNTDYSEEATGSSDPHDWNAVKPQQAAKVLRHLAQTGKVDWEVAFQ